MATCNDTDDLILYQHRDNDLEITVLGEETGSKINASEFENAVYVVYVGSTGTEVLRRTLGDGVSVISGDKFNINVPKESVTFNNETNQHKHTFVVGYTPTEERPALFDEDVQIVSGIDL